MKRIFTALILTLALSSNAHAWGNWVAEPYDKALHFGVSAGMSWAGYKVCREVTDWSKTACRITSGVATFAITGPGKEYTDVNFDYNDMKASGAGTAFGIGMTFVF